MVFHPNMVFSVVNLLMVVEPVNDKTQIIHEAPHLIQKLGAVNLWKKMDEIMPLVFRLMYRV
jgi:hypothetical protein